MNRSSVEAALSFTPALSGRFEWDNEDRTVTLISDSPLARTNYTGTILRTALDIRGGPLDGNYSGVVQNTASWCAELAGPRQDPHGRSAAGLMAPVFAEARVPAAVG